ncbi:hypothetical protein [Neobacillus ginsengisoli]|uniref:Cytosolic protein n=1 Tax=Neobacillus ginsengisoli TaxID=904295 RepID=A0ABT9XNC1_9BACI|nr:hypothetical protein [Neobacillus ginsengisoli]MDQ0197035.1 hypothetical protein [Neobacillus ginsengisoli]
MAIFGNLFLRFSKQIETSDSFSDEQLKTHYYKANFNQLFQTVEKLFHDDADCRITTVSKEHGEIAVEVTKPFSCFLIVTVVTERPLETAVDFKISTERFSVGGNYPALKKRIISYYERLNQLHTFIRTGKNR